MLRERRTRTAWTALGLAIALLAACGDGGAAAEEAAGPAPEQAREQDPLAALRANATETAARAEHSDAVVELMHILVSFEGAPGLNIKGRTLEQAEQLAGELFARIRAGEDFEAVRAGNTDDKGPLTYKLSSARTPGATPRGKMVRAFGDIGWRLAVGEVGVAAYDPGASPYGWHIIKRVN